MTAPTLAQSTTTPDQLAAAQRARQQQIAGQAAAQTSRLWQFLAAFSAVAAAAQILDVVQAAMREAARGAQDYTTAVSRAWGAEPDPAGTVAWATFATTASDGRPLESLLEQPALEVASLVSDGMDHTQASAVGVRHLQRIVLTQVADASRVATGVAVANDRALKGYIRHLTLPSCSRCIILAGRWYRWSDGFPRHPQCDCVHIPAAEAVDPPSPRAAYDAMTDEERAKAGWSGHDQRAIDDGADLNQVTNYRRELKSVQIAGRPVQTTTVGTTRRGVAGRRGARVRLTPESIYAEADRLGWSRDQTIAQLRRFGYIL